MSSCVKGNDCQVKVAGNANESSRVLTEHLLYALAWASFGIQHSCLARPTVQQRLERWVGRCYRLGFNALAVVHFGLVIALGAWLFGFADAARLPGFWQAPLFAIALVGLVIMTITLARRDLASFLGFRQLHAEATPEECLDTKGVFGWVRHPLYFGMLLLFWGLAQTEFGLATALCASTYIFIGAWFEERDLLARFGTEYRDYRQRVPMLIPWPKRN